MENNNLIIEYLVSGEIVSKKKYENHRKIKNAKRNGGAVTKKKTGVTPQQKDKPVVTDVSKDKKKSIDVVFQQKDKPVHGDASKDKKKPADFTAVQCDGPLDITFLKNGKFVSKEQFHNNVTNKGGKDKESKDKGSKDKEGKDKEGKDKGGKDKESKDKGSKDKEGKDKGGKDKESKNGYDKQKMEDAKQVFLEKKIADLEQQLHNKENENERLEINLYNEIKENQTLQLKIKQTQNINEGLKENIVKKNLKINALESKMQRMKQTKLDLKKKKKELRRTITNQKEQLAKLTSQKLDDLKGKPSGSDVSRHPNNVLLEKDDTTSSCSVKNNLNEIVIVKNQELNRVITRSDIESSSMRVCAPNDNARLNSLETAVNLMKQQLHGISNELDQLRDIGASSNNVGTYL